MDMDMALETNRSFVAIAAPSMEGKTQAAFTLRRVKPLYFPLSEAASGLDCVYNQSIYRNFHPHALVLKDCAESDEKVIRTYTSTTSLLSTHIAKKFWTLGFLKRMVEVSQLNFDMADNWMTYYSNIANFDFEPASIDSIPSDYFSQFCLFLDEFSAHTWAIFVRNLSRAVGMKCVCSNTNTRVANLVGTGSSSGAGEHPVWSAVVTKLNPASELHLDETFQLNESIQRIKDVLLLDTANQERTGRVLRFLNNLRIVQLKNVRAGVAVYIAKALKFYAESLEDENGTVTIGKLMDFVISQVSNDLKNRKPSLEIQDAAAYGKIALLLPETYETNATVNQEIISTFWNQPLFLEHHLFYLHNPQVGGSWLFLTFPPAPDNPNRSLRVYPRKIWDDEYTYLKKNEIFTILACLFVHYSLPVARILHMAKNQTSKRSSNVFASPNREALKLSGNDLEVSVAATVTDASQHSFDHQTVQIRHLRTAARLNAYRTVYSFSGQNGTEFIKNLIVNLIIDTGFQMNPDNRISPISVSFDNSVNFNLARDLLDKCLIPFLYSINNPIPMLESFSDAQSGFFLSSYSRTKDKDQVDGKFKMLFDGQPACVASECKNWRSNIGVGILKKILEKASKHDNCLLSIVFCSSSVNPVAASACLTYCETERINVYRVVRPIPSQYSYNIVPYFRNDKIYSAPRMTCIIFESSNINHTQR